MIRRAPTFLSLLIAFLAASVADGTETGIAKAGIRFPADGGVLNVVEFGATPNDDQDDTAAIQAALDKDPKR